MSHNHPTLPPAPHPNGLSPAGPVWNRAVLEAGGSAPRSGDTALAGLMRFHGLAMNGGIDHALDVLSATAVDAAIAGFRYFDLPEVASVLAATRFARRSESQLEKLQQRYATLVPNDAALVAAFEKRYKDSPEEFAPL